MIYFFTPYSPERLLGDAYNRCCEIVPQAEDWICLTDGDTCFLTSDYGTIISNSLAQFGDSYDLLTCYTNRIGTKVQCLRPTGKTYQSGDILHHRNLAHMLSKRPSDVIPINQAISGFFLLFKKSTWLEFNFPLQSSEGGILGIDYHWSKLLLTNGRRIGIISNLYIFHYYRLHGTGLDHLL